MKYSALVPEILVSDFKKSIHFYTAILGFKVEYDRPESQFAFISIGEAQIMIEQMSDHWQTGELQYPFGRGINFEILVDDLKPMLDRLGTAKHALFQEPEDVWYKTDEGKVGQRQFLVQDPDGYLLRFCQSID